MTRMSYSEMARRRWTQTDEERFLAHITVDPSGCWLWDGIRQNKGYGVFSVRSKNLSAHRWAYEHWVGLIPVGLEICHTCDVRHCVNPAHMFVGTRADNMADARSKGRDIRGTRALNAKLDWAKVAAIRAEPSYWGVNADLARRYGVARSLVGLIRRDLRWVP